MVELNSNISTKKSKVICEHILDINSNCKVKIIDDFICKGDIALIYDKRYDFLINAFDSLTCKVVFIEHIITGMIVRCSQA